MSRRVIDGSLMDTMSPHTMKYPPFLVEWFLRRNITIDILNLFHISWNGYQIIIPIYNYDGRHVFNKYRRDPRSEEGAKYMYDPGGTMVLFGANLIKDKPRVIVCEGELDALFLWSQGFPAVSTTGGAGAFYPGWSDLLVGKDVIICYDNDMAGAKGAITVQKAVPWAKIATVPARFGIKDLTDFGIHLFSAGRNLKYSLEQIFLAAQQYNVDDILLDFESPDSEKKLIMGIYHDRIKKLREMRAKKTALDYAELRLLDALLEHHAKLLQDVKRALKKKKPIKDVRSVEAAKAVPITNYIKFDRSGMAKCLWHEEDSGSMHYIQSSNKLHCFGCSVTKDVIEVVMALKRCTWAEAMNQLV